MLDEARDDLFDLVHESIFTRDLQGRILSWNAASAELYGWSAQDAIGRRAHDLLVSRHETPMAELERLAEESGRWDGEIERRTATGAQRLIEARWSVHRDAAGAAVEIIEIGRDVTDRRAAEVALRRSERRYSSLFQAMAASFWELDFNPVGGMLKRLFKSGVTDLPAHFAANPEYVRDMMRATRIIDVNDETVKLFAGGVRGDMGESVEPYWTDEGATVYAASVIAAVSGKPDFAAEVRFRRKDRSEFDGLFTACFPDDGVARGTLLVGVIDISAQKQATAELRLLQDKFAHSARVSMLGELTASIAHEVNQPLAAIATNGAAGLRWLGRDEPNVDQALKLTQRIVADAQRAGDIIARIRTMAANRPATPEVVSVNAVIEESAQFLQHELQAHGVKARLDLESDLPRVLADRTQIQQVLVNLAVNAVQSMAQAATMAPELRIASRTIVGDRIQVTVADNGPGLADQALERSFDSFFTTKVSGMGMGLPICRSIVEAHGGAIVADNTAGGGAVLTVTLPIHVDG